ncbi:hypothetical protein E1B28_009200 [Marasmius oreades]|uniref:RRM domain-containing protein n=1 Tax=Marasmius oreades TaxID=181124 RepID=A0A9P7RZZ9_9AGAR|nr:uncharacterized protein E1B28_009200 [Marasmius oreades]KAG7092891.1 hypothetical protein E1B28_009200 [Marasmius oreades]
MARRLYLGKLPTDVRSEEVSKFFESAGRVVDCRVMTGFGFIEFENSKDAEDAVRNFDGKSFMGSSLVVQFAKEGGRPKRDHFEDRREFSVRSRRPPAVRITVSGLSRDTSWQDLKDFGRDAGTVSFSDISRDVPGQGVLEYPSREDAERAVKQLDNTDLRGRPVRVALDDSHSGADNYRRDDRRDDRYGREDRYKERDDRRDDRYRRDRSKSPRRGDHDDRRRSPPARRGEDDRRPPGDEDRRHDKRREEKEERFDDRPRHANGDGGYR